MTALNTFRQRIVLLWSVTGMTLLFLPGIVRLGARGVDTIRMGLSPLEWAALAVVTASFIWFEGVRGIGGRFAPSVGRRLQAVLNERALWQTLAPLYLISAVGVPARTAARTWAGLALIVVAVLIVREFPEPWRGIVDFGVTCALVYGFTATLFAMVRALR